MGLRTCIMELMGFEKGMSVPCTMELMGSEKGMSVPCTMELIVLEKGNASSVHDGAHGIMRRERGPFHNGAHGIGRRVCRSASASRECEDMRSSRQRDILPSLRTRTSYNLHASFLPIPLRR